MSSGVGGGSKFVRMEVAAYSVSVCVGVWMYVWGCVYLHTSICAFTREPARIKLYLHAHILNMFC